MHLVRDESDSTGFLNLLNRVKILRALNHNESRVHDPSMQSNDQVWQTLPGSSTSRFGVLRTSSAVRSQACRDGS